MVLIAFVESLSPLLSLSYPFLTLMGFVIFTRAPASTPSWISLPGPNARTVRERSRAAGVAAVERRGADKDNDADRATHRRDAAGAVACISSLEVSFCFERREREERAGCSRARRQGREGGGTPNRLMTRDKKEKKKCFLCVVFFPSERQLYNFLLVQISFPPLSLSLSLSLSLARARAKPPLTAA